MLILVTGINGAGKTLNTIKYVNESSTFKVQNDDGSEIERPVYYFNIKGLTLDWTELDEQGVRDWESLPHGSIIIIDEAYKIFPTRKGNAPVPPFIQALAEHRHKGMDFVFICQRGIGQVDAFLRGLVGRHIHLERQFNTSRVKWLEWQKCQDDTSDYHAKKEAQTKTVSIDPKYFTAYKSAELHTMKSNIPWFKLGLVAGGILLVLFLIYFAYSIMSKPRADSASVKPVSNPVAGLSIVPGSDRKPVNNLELYVPRVKDFPHTAPIYDELTLPRSYPRLQCYRWESGPARAICKCFTQQATFVSISPPVCNSIIDNGYFDPARPDLAFARKHGHERSRPAQQADVPVTRQ